LCRVAVNSLVYDIMRYLGATIIAGLPHPRSISRYRLIDKNPSGVHTAQLICHLAETGGD